MHRLTHRADFVRLKKFIPILLWLLVAACSDSPEGSQQSVGMKVAIDNQVSQQIQVVSAIGTKAGKVNPVEVRITLKNVSTSPQQVLFVGQWLVSKGGENGGSQRVLKLPAGHTETITEGMRSKRVTHYKARLSTTEKSQDQLLTEMLASNPAIAKGNGMTYSDTPAAEKIPEWSVRGVANSRPFDAKTIIFQTLGNGQWTLAISDRAFDPVKEGLGIARLNYPDVQTVNVNLAGAPFKDTVFEQDMQYGGGMFQIKPSADSKGTTSWNTSLAYIITITDGPEVINSHTSCGRPKPGKISGTLFISFEGSEAQIKNSWVSGTFEDAVILYCS